MADCIIGANRELNTSEIHIIDHMANKNDKNEYLHPFMVIE